MSELLEASVDRVGDFIADHLGLQADRTRRADLAAVIRDRMEAVRAGGFEGYWQRLTSPNAMRDELRALAERLTVGETYFFRGGNQMQAFVEAALPARLQAREEVGRLHILSAGCASGEETASLAIHVLEHVPDRASWRISIHGVDVNPVAIRKAEAGRYAAWSLRETPASVRACWFRPDGSHFRLVEAVREALTFEERNLLDGNADFWKVEHYDVIFCRNVLMYLTPEASRAVIGRLARALLPGGFLFLGHAETLRGLSQDFHLLHTHDAFYYQRKDRLETPGPPPAGAPAALSESALERALEADTAWVDAIHKASERIASLSERKAAPTQPLAAPRRPTADLSCAMELLRQERFGDAAAMLRVMPPADADAQLLLAVVLANRGELAEAEQVCGRLLALDDLNAGAHYVTALCREHAGDLDGAMEHDELAIHLDAGFAMPHFHQGLLSRRAGDAAGARRALNEALQLLGREEASRILLFGGGFSREVLLQLCRAELRACGGDA